MKSVITLFSIIVTLFSCTEKLIEKVETTHPNQKPRHISYFKEIDGKELKVQEKEFYENGQFKMGGPIKNGLKDGVWEAYHKNGKLWSKGNFINGLREGYGENYYPNGKMREEGNYQKGKQIGKWKYYNEQGILVEEKMK